MGSLESMIVFFIDIHPKDVSFALSCDIDRGIRSAPTARKTRIINNHRVGYVYRKGDQN